jgi:CubicO group peptidase (beta-lactamase class C family)
MTLSRRSFAVKSAIAVAGCTALPRDAAARATNPEALRGSKRSAAPRMDDPDLATMLALAGVPGIAHAKVSAGKTPEISVFGVTDAETKAPVRIDTVFEAASLSKPTVAYVALLMADRGKLDLDAPIRDTFGSSPVPDDPRADRITIRHVLSHSSGMQNWRFNASDKLRVAFEPGSAFQYSGEGFVLVQRILERLTNTSFASLMRRELFEPLGMNDATFLWHEGVDARLARPHGGRGGGLESYARKGGKALASYAASLTPPREASSLTYPELERAAPTVVPGMPPFPNFLVPNAAASLLTTPGDYGRFVALLLDDSAAPAALRLRPATREAMRTPRVRVAPGLSWGLGIGVEERGGNPLLWHWGDNGGTKNFLVADVKAKKGDIIFANGSGGLKVADRLLRAEYGPLDAFLWV